MVRAVGGHQRLQAGQVGQQRRFAHQQLAALPCEILVGLNRVLQVGGEAGLACCFTMVWRISRLSGVQPKDSSSSGISSVVRMRSRCIRRALRSAIAVNFR